MNQSPSLKANLKEGMLFYVLLPGVIVRHILDSSAGKALNLDDIPKPRWHEEYTDILAGGTCVGVFMVLLTEFSHSLILYLVYPKCGGIVGFEFRFNVNVIQTVIMAILNDQEYAVEVGIASNDGVMLPDG